MDFKRKDIEIMAPAGSYESLMAAINAGADSIYFGASNLNMRSRSSNNFTLEDIRKVAQICKENGVKSYLTVNTILYDSDLKKIHEIIDVAKESEISAIIAADISPIGYARQKGVEVHISTQCNISNIDAVRFYAQFADVVVLARELSMKQVAEIYKKIEQEDIRGPHGELIKIEMFAHGALCMAVSGKCYISLHENNASANRGACLQSCRKGYTVTEKESGKQIDIDNEYIMSPQDLCTIDFVDLLLKSGVRVLKIEGRARPPEYVKTVVEAYDEAVRAVIDGSYNATLAKQMKERLANVFNRGFWDGYYLGRRLGKWATAYGSQAKKRKVYIGKGTNYFSKIKVAEFLMESYDLSVGDEILITGPTTGAIETVVKEIRVDLKSVQTTIKGESFSIPLDSVIRRSDKLYKLVTPQPDFLP